MPSWLYVGSVVFFVSCLSLEANAKVTMENELVLFRKAIGPDREIVIVRGPLIDRANMDAVLAKELLRQSTAIYAVRVEIHTAGQPTALLASRLRVETQNPNLGTKVLDVLVEAGTVVVALVEGHEVGLWRVTGGSNNHADWAVLRSADWAFAAPLRPLDDRHVAVRLERSIDNGLVVAEVTDLTALEPMITLFEQTTDQWAFMVRKQWRKKK